MHRLPLLLLIFAALACNKKTVSHENYPDFSGLWLAEEGDFDYYMNFQTSGQTSYWWFNNVADDSGGVSGYAKIDSKENYLLIDHVKFSIGTYPTEAPSGDWFMELEEITYWKN
jgi:hypothetical protein